MKLLRKDLVKREEQLITSILNNADVILSTLTGASKEGPLKFVKDEHLDLLIIDEAAQALEIGCWIPMLKVKRCLFVQFRTGPFTNGDTAIYFLLFQYHNTFG